MSGFSEYENYDAVGLAELVRKKEVSPAELCEAAIERVERLNPRINAVVHPMFDLARAEAAGELPDGPFRGVPFLLKDLLDAYAGVPLTSACRAWRRNVPSADCELVRRYKKAGLVTLGKTNLPELGLVSYTEPELFGACRNPWDLERTPGGSSGGSAAAVAAGIVPIASGGDGGGSIRIPASNCGLFGLKPTRGRVPSGPEHGELWQGAVVEHVLTRSVRDSAAALDAIHGIDPGAPYDAPAPEWPYFSEVGRDPGKLRIAFDTSSPVDRPVHLECVKAVDRAAKLLMDLGHHVEEARPAYNGKTLAVSFVTMVCGEVAAELRNIRKNVGPAAARDRVELPTRTLGLLGETISAGEFAFALQEWNRVSRALGAFLGRYDLYLTPTLAQPPLRIGELAMKPVEKSLAAVLNAFKAGKALRATGIVEKMAIDIFATTPYTILGNVTGFPAMSVPLHWTPDGLPIGVQFFGRFGDEGTLFRIASQLEQAAPWADRRPPIW